MKFSLSLQFLCIEISFRISNGFPSANGGDKQVSGGENKPFSSFKSQYVENGWRYVYKVTIIGSRICAFD